VNRILTRARLAEGVAVLCARDDRLRAVVNQFGPPPQWYRPPGFRTLLYLILEQQVSLASARATWEKLVALLGEEPTPDLFLGLTDDALRSAGFSRQKTRYGRLLARAVQDRSLKPDRLQSLDDDAVRARLTAITGIGNWTADVYMMEAMRRPDIWPVGDLALAVAAQEVLGLPERPDEAALREIGGGWRPWRAVAARILWHHYLSTPRRGGGAKPT